MSDDILLLPPPPPNARVHYGPAAQRFGELRLPTTKGPYPVLVNIHGGFWRNKYDFAHTGHLCAALTAKGIATWNLEYRRVGDQGGGWPGTFRDIVDGYRFLPRIAQEYELDSGRIAVMGHSAGGQLALCLAAHEPSVKFAISLAGVADLRRAWELHLSKDAVAEFFGGSPADAADHYKEADPMQLEVAAEQWLIHGLIDNTIPPDFSRNYHEKKRARGENVHLVEIEKASHFDLIDPRSAAWKKVEEIVAKCF